MTPRNDMNLRFAVFENLETDAVLSYDDDLPTTRQEIVRVFRC